MARAVKAAAARAVEDQAGEYRARTESMAAQLSAAKAAATQRERELAKKLDGERAARVEASDKLEAAEAQLATVLGGKEAAAAAIEAEKSQRAEVSEQKAR